MSNRKLRVKEREQRRRQRRERRQRRQRSKKRRAVGVVPMVAGVKVTMFEANASTTGSTFGASPVKMQPPAASAFAKAVVNLPSAFIVQPESTGSCVWLALA